MLHFHGVRDCASCSCSYNTASMNREALICTTSTHTVQWHIIHVKVPSSRNQICGILQVGCRTVGRHDNTMATCTSEHTSKHKKSDVLARDGQK